MNGFIPNTFYFKQVDDFLFLFDRSYEEAARDQGASNWQTIRYVVLPIIAPSLIGVALSILALVILLALLAVRVILSGISDLALALRYWGETKYNWLLLVVGLLSIAFGLFLIIYPIFSLNISVVQILGAFLLVYGAGLLVQAFQLRPADAA